MAIFKINEEHVLLMEHLPLNKDFNNLIIFTFPRFSSIHPEGMIKCKKAIEISLMLDNFLILKDSEKNVLTFLPDNTIRLDIYDNTISWSKLMRALEIHVFPNIVHNIIEIIHLNGFYKIDEVNVTYAGIEWSGTFVEIENVDYKISFKNNEVKLRNKKRIFHRKTLVTNYTNVIILPYLIDNLKLIHKL